MKDLKHLIYFEDLLSEANNALVKQATADGKKALGYTCYFVPEVLLNLGGCFSVRLRAPGTSNTDIGTYYMTNKTCPFTRSILERSMEGGYNFLSAMLSSETCQMMHRAHEYFDIMGLVKEQNPDFFLSMMDVPFVTTKAAYEHYENQPLEKVCGVDISDKAIRAAIEEHNDICGIISELGELRKLPNPPITSYEFHVLQLVSECCPQYLIKEKLRETLREVSKRKVDPKPNYRARLVVTGSEVDDPAFTKLAARQGADRDPRGRERAYGRCAALSEHERVPPIHEQGKAGTAPQLSQAACKRLRRRRHPVSPDEVLRILELRARHGRARHERGRGHTLHRRREGIHDGFGRPAPHEVPGLCRKHRDKEAPGR